MFRKIILFLTPLLILTVLFLLIILVANRDGGKGALQVTSVPISQVYLDGKHIGKTPLCLCELPQLLDTGGYNIKLVPTEAGFKSFEQKITLYSGVYAEKNGNGGFDFTRGYGNFVKGKRVLVVEDVLTTGGSVKKVIEMTKEAGGKIVGLAVVANRGGVKPEDVGVDEIDALINLEFNAMEAKVCTLCRDGVPVNTNVGKGKLFLAGKKIA